MAGAEIFHFPTSQQVPAGLMFELPLDSAGDLHAALLSNRLHRELDIESLMCQLLREISSHCSVSGVYYTLPDTGEVFCAGTESTYRQRVRLQFAGDFLGELEIHSAHPLSEPSRRLILALESPLHNAITHFRLKQLASRDPLTQLGNRRDMTTSVAREVSRAQRFGQTFSMLVVDIDHFKQINDRYGHSTGDDVIRGVASQIRDCLRTYDCAFRYGGEEFVVLLTQTSATPAAQIAERLRRQIENKVGIDSNPEHNVTVSIGLAEFIPTQTAEDLFNRADRALYQAKAGGRNQVISAL